MESSRLKNLSSVGVPSLPEVVQHDIREAIINGVFKPGDVLRQEDLARRLGVSRAPLREALPRLEAEGIVVLHPRRGYSVVSLEPDEIEEVFDLRELLEVRAADLATKRRSEHNVAEVYAILAQMAEVDAKSLSGMARWFDLNWQFHDAIIKASGHGHLAKILSNLRIKLEPYIRVEVAFTGDVNQANEEHRDIAAAYMAGQPEMVAQLVQSHIRHTASRLLNALRADRQLSGNSVSSSDSRV